MKTVKCFAFIWAILFPFLIGCGNANTKSDVMVEEFNDSIQVIECITDKKIPDGFTLGKVMECKGHNKEEENMLSQFRSYNLALLRGDIDNAIHYQYPDAAKYFKEYYPGESNDGVMRKLFEEFSMHAIEQVKRFENHGIEINIVVSRLIRKVTYGENIFYVFEIVSNMVNDNLQLHTTPDLTLAVSSNNGKNWTFNAMNDDTPNILRISFSNEIVDKVMGY
ncbi:MAG: hypothetical protein J1E58_00795 [Prevotella sp.]|nr:hypothetical protein [Prevotella sp.]